MYSVVRLQANKQAYEVPVDGDWVTVAVVAERGDVRVTGGSANFLQGKGDRDGALDDGDDELDVRQRVDHVDPGPRDLRVGVGRHRGDDENDNNNGYQ